MKLKRTHIALGATSLGTLLSVTAASAASVEVPEEIADLENGARNMVSSARLTMHYTLNGKTSSASGSATFIAPNVLITVGHNFLKLSKDNQSGELMGNEKENVYEWTTPGGAKGTFTAKDVHFFDKVGFAKGFKNDLAVIVLPNYQKSEGSYGHLTDSYNSVKEGDILNIFGYPTGKFVPLVNQKVERTDDYGDGITGVAYQGSYPGMSGGGIFNTKGDLIGVHQNGVVGQRSGGIILSPKQLEWVKAAIDGKLNNGWGVDGGKRVYFENGKKLVNTVKKIDGSYYRFGPDGDAKAIKVTLKAVKTEYVADPNLSGGEHIVKRAGKGALVDDLGQEIEAGENAIVHVGTKSKVVEKLLPKKNYYVVNPSLKKGESHVLAKGEDGKEVVTTTYTLNTDKGLIVKDDKVVNHPSDRLVEVSSKDEAIGEELPLDHPLRKDLKLIDVEKPKVETPKVEAPKVEAPGTPEKPKAPEAPVKPNVETPKVEAPIAPEKPKVPEAPVKPNVETPKVATPVAPKKPKAPEAPVQPKLDTPKVENPVLPEKPKAPEAPVQPKVETPKVEAPTAPEKPKAPEAPVQPKLDTPKVENPVLPEKPKAPEAPVQPKVDTPKVTTPVAPEKPKAPEAPVQPKVETPKVDTPVAPEKPKAPESPVQPKVNTPKVEPPVAPEKPKAPEGPVLPKVNTPKVEAPVTPEKPKAPDVQGQHKLTDMVTDNGDALIQSELPPYSETGDALVQPELPEYKGDINSTNTRFDTRQNRNVDKHTKTTDVITSSQSKSKVLPQTGDMSLVGIGLMSLMGSVTIKKRKK